MKPKFKLENFPGKYVMRCPKEWQANIFCKVLKDSNKKWATRWDYTEDNLWRLNGSNTVYFFNEGYVGDLRYDIKGYKVLKFSKFSWT